MQDQRDIFGLGQAGKLRRCGCLGFRLDERERADAFVGGDQFEDLDVEFLSDCQGGRRAAFFHDQGFRMQVRHIKFKFIGTINRIQWRCSRAGGDAHKSSRHFRAVRQNNRYPVLAADAEAVERFNGFALVGAQGVIAQGPGARCFDCNGVSGAGRQ